MYKMVIIFNFFFVCLLTKSLQRTLIKHLLADINIISSVLRHCDSASCEKIKRDRKIKQGRENLCRVGSCAIGSNLGAFVTKESVSLSLLKYIQEDFGLFFSLHLEKTSTPDLELRKHLPIELLFVLKQKTH